MKTFTKTLLSTVIASSLFLCGAVLADDEEVKHKFIEVKALKHQDVRVVVEEDGREDVIVFTAEELKDDFFDYEAKVGHLDEETRETVLQAIMGTRHIFVDSDTTKLMNGHQQVFVINNGEGEVVHEIVGDGEGFIYDYDTEVSEDAPNGEFLTKKIIVSGDSSHVVLKGHSNAIIKMIERGEFTPDELDDIQKALDLKR